MPNEKLKVGSHIFQLQVVDDSTNPSDPAQVTVIVVDSQKPTAVIAACDEQGNPLVRNRVPFGSGFMLDGRKSVDIGGRIVTYIWTRVEG
jgi:hypothetical protein